MIGSLALVLAAPVPRAVARAARAPATLCSVTGGLPRFSNARTRGIVAASQVIVRATVLGEVSPPSGDRGPTGRNVVFAVDEVLRGSDVPDTLQFYGVIDDQDAWPVGEDDEIPHKSYIRRWGGPCRAITYQARGRYLLLLRREREGGPLHPYWMILAPTNNLIRGADDRWVQWVRAEITRNPVRPATTPATRKAP
jgi:hypothetical protein